eukprot:CAMPEP_0197827720 /NCGR_PEP_ID=MMETSP1437-20131217/4449_1 /TAXON_ID=49252 ORGANISM="Eucampia antarctica, Strain CCMP1452" /NCGR_SAMPLE_ID=MMETSP1437 /ASSEMBLY_ACC=CAM_ASM_001096 /LENGTH=673 /DNA_ID=CAMNT_0043428693 /DNA_START=1 /DNA_END=2022 /DNA_ORIENTATION=+
MSTSRIGGVSCKKEQQRHVYSYNSNQYRSYVFLPSSLSEWMQSIRSSTGSKKSDGKKVVLSVRLRNTREQMQNNLTLMKKELIQSAKLSKSKNQQKLRHLKKEFVRSAKQSQSSKTLLKMQTNFVQSAENISLKKNRMLFLQKQRTKSSSWIRNYIKKKRHALIYSKYNIFLPPASQQEWFDPSTGYPLTSKDYVTERYINPWNNTPHVNGQIFTFPQFLSWRLRRFYRRLFHQPTLHPAPPEKPFQFTPSNQDKVKLSWLGHSSTLVEMHGITILTDPHFSKRAGHVARYSPCPISCVEQDLPSTINVCVLSHDHYDHLDHETLSILHDKVQYFIVPMGLKQWLMEEINIPSHRIIQLEWWQSVVLPAKQNNNSSSTLRFLQSPSNLLSLQDLPLNAKKITQQKQSNEDKIVVTCTPAQHYCSRTPFDRNRRLWCSFAITSYKYHHETTTIPHKLSFYFAGDTGVPTQFPLFRQIGDVLGPFDLAALPIGAYRPKYFLAQSHCSPDEAVLMHRDLRSKKSVGIHWGTFDLADEDYTEPPKLLQHATNTPTTTKTDPTIDFTTIAHGDSIESNDNTTPTVTSIEQEGNKKEIFQPNLQTTNNEKEEGMANEVSDDPSKENTDCVADEDAMIAMSVVNSLEELVTENDDILTLLENDNYDIQEEEDKDYEQQVL